MAGLEPSRNELNILGFSPPRLACSSLRPQYFHTGLGRRLRVVRQPLVPAAGRRHLEARGAGPVDQLADQRRLVAIGEAVDHAGRGRAAGEQRAAEGVGLDRHHHHALAVAEGFQRMLDGGDRIAGRSRPRRRSPDG